MTMVNAAVRLEMVRDEAHDEQDGHHWCPPLDRRAALRLLAMTSVAVAAGCGGSSGTAAATTATAAGTTASTTVLSVSSTSVAQAASVTLTATVSPAAATGAVTFYDGTTALGTATLSSGVATLTTSFSSAGVQMLTAVYAGSTTYASSTSAAVSVTVTASSTCTATLEGEEGPYFVDDSASAYHRSNILSNLDGTQTQAGIPLTLTLYVYDTKNSCGPMQNVQVDIWHCNALGVYSAESVEATVGQTWLRGYQLTDATGKVTFTTIVPGWYQGRTTHIHLRLRSTYDSTDTGGTNTMQLLFDQTLVDTIDTTVAPYSTIGKNTTTNAADRVYSQEEKGTTQMTLTGSVTAGYTASFNVYLPIAS